MRRAADWAGRALLVTGALTLLFVAYQLWGTELVHDWEQRSLARHLDEQLEAAPPPAPERPRAATDAKATTTTSTLPLPAVGDPVGRLEIPAIGLDEVIVEGVERDELRKGPGHYPHSPLPGRAGNAALAGHRTTYGAPFLDLDRVVPGDEIRVTTPEGTFVYVVEGTSIVTPEDVSVVLDQGDDRLTLTTCHPKYSARQRLVVSAQLDGDPLDAEPPPPPDTPVRLVAEETPQSGARPAVGAASRIDGAEGGVRALGLATVTTAGAVFGVGGAWWWAFRRRPRWWVWGGGAVPFLVALFFFFGEVERLLPRNF